MWEEETAGGGEGNAERGKKERARYCTSAALSPVGSAAVAAFGRVGGAWQAVRGTVITVPITASPSRTPPTVRAAHRALSPLPSAPTRAYPSQLSRASLREKVPTTLTGTAGRGGGGEAGVPVGRVVSEENIHYMQMGGLTGEQLGRRIWKKEKAQNECEKTETRVKGKYRTTIAPKSSKHQ